MAKVNNKKVLEAMLHEKALVIAKELQEELSSKTAAVLDENDTMQLVPYKTEIVDDGKEVRLVPKGFSNGIDERGNSLTIEKYGFAGNLTMTKAINKLVAKGK